ncbi:MAG: threonylcarbamoyl-AMP synthase [Bacteroidetes bacterium]|nr:threonylcarbamoyl-AMP synthase [Bacteroidota bacterium]
MAIQWLEALEPVAIPTETVYGLAANALSDKAVARIFEVKNRPSFDPLIVHVASWDQAVEHIDTYPSAAVRLAQVFWPGPLTLLLPKKAHIPDLVTSGLPRVALRAPLHPLTQALLQQGGFPLAAPSANPFGYISPTSAQHVQQQLDGFIPYILDGGNCSVGVESTIVGWEGPDAVVYRLGGLSVESLESEIGPLKVRLNQSSDPAAPGMLKSHYAPRKPLFLGNLAQLVESHWQEKAGVLSLKPIAGLPPQMEAFYLSETGNLQEAARNLFHGLRVLDASDVTLILAEPVPAEGLGLAINDRLRRASIQ